MNSWFSTVLSKTTAAIQRRSQGLLFVLVLFIGVTSMALGATSIKRSINAPFARSNANSEVAANGAEAANANKDTDGDGLFDADELGVYGTSPYLADSDSDGTSDSEELAQKTDPNCPAGKTCTRELAGQEPTAGSGLTDILTQGLPGVSSAPSTTELRNLLKQAGIPSAEVDALSDEQLLQAYNAALANNQDENAPTNTAAPSSDLNALSAEQVRSLLIKNGVPQEKLEEVSDEDLMRIYKETLQEAQQKQTNQ